MLRSVEWYICTDVSGQPIGPIFKGQEFKEEFVPAFRDNISVPSLRVKKSKKKLLLGLLDIEDGTDMLS
jgi:hypothetical protein